MKKILKRILLILLALVLLISAGFVAWASFPLGPGAEATAALASDSSVTVQMSTNWITFSPAGAQPTAGFIFYPGGRVDYRSYAPLLKPLAAKGYLVVLVRMPLSMAVFSPGKADQVISAFPDIKTWSIGGHSLGGAMAANYVYTHPDALKGLVSWASYPAENNSLANFPIKVFSIYGSEDGGLTGIESSAALLPADTTWYRIEGGNHAQFGDYGLQPGDGTATILPQEQWGQIIEETAAFLQGLQE